MPWKSLRAKTIDVMKSHLLKLKKDLILHEVMDDKDSIEDNAYLHQTNMFNEMSSCHYLYQNSHYRKTGTSLI